MFVVNVTEKNMLPFSYLLTAFYAKGRIQESNYIWDTIMMGIFNERKKSRELATALILFMLFFKLSLLFEKSYR